MNRSSLSVLEDFYGRELDQELVCAVSETPPEQLYLLAQKVIDYHRRIERRLWSYHDLHGTAENDTNSHPVLNAEAPFFLHDETYFAGGAQYAISESPTFKHLLLYCDKMILPDPFIDWAENAIVELELHAEGLRSDEDMAWVGPQAATAVTQLIPLRELVARNQLTLIGSRETFSPYSALEDVGGVRLPLAFEMGVIGSESVSGISEIWRGDPYLAWVLVNQVAKVDDWELVSQSLRELGEVQNAAEYILQNLSSGGQFVGYGGRSGSTITSSRLLKQYATNGLSVKNIDTAVQFSTLFRNLNISPVVSNGDTRRHLLWGSQILLGEHPTVGRAGVNNSPDLAVPIHYKVPSVAGVSLPDLIRLRLNEELYEDVRTSLVAMAEGVNSFGVTRNYSEYQRTVYAIAESTIRPTYERLNREIRKATWAAKIGGLLASGLVKMGFTGIAALAAGPAGLAIKPLGNASGNLAQKVTEKKISSGKHEKKVATSLLVSLLDPVVSSESTFR